MAHTNTRVVISHVHSISRTNAAVRAVWDRRFNETPTIIAHNLTRAHKLLKKHKTENPVLVYITNPFVGEELRACPVSVVLILHPYSHQVEWMISRNNMGGLCAKLYKYGVALEAGSPLNRTDPLFKKLVQLLLLTLPRLPGVRSGYLNRGLNSRASVQSAPIPALAVPSTAPLPSAPSTPLPSALSVPLPSAPSAPAAITNDLPAPNASEKSRGCPSIFPENYEEILTPFAPEGLDRCQYACRLRSRDDFDTLSPPDKFIGQYVRMETTSLYLKMKDKFFEAYERSVKAGFTKNFEEWAEDISNKHSNRRLRRSNSVRLYRCYEALGWLDPQHFRD